LIVHSVLMVDESKSKATEEAPILLIRYERLIPWTISLLALLGYLAFLTKNYYWDGVVFAETIERAKRLPELFHPSHLFYNVVGYLLYKAAGSFGQAARPLKVLQIGNCIFSALAALVFFRILRKSLGSVYLAATLTVLFAFSATWWKFSTDADAYIPSTLFMLIAFYLVLPGSKPRPFLVASAHVCAILFHQLAIFFYPVAALALFYQGPESDRGNRIGRVTRYTAAAAALTLAVYVSCFYLAFKNLSFGPFVRWITYYTPENGFTFNAWKDLSATVSGNLRLFFGGRFNLIVPWLNSAIVILFIVLALCIVALVVQVARSPKGLMAFLRAAPKATPGKSEALLPPADARNRHHRQLVALCIIWCCTYLVFLFFFIPLNAFYRLFYLPPLIILIGLGLVKARASPEYKPKGRVALAVAATAFCNFLFLIFPYSHVRQNTPLSLALAMNQVWPAGTEVYYFNMNTDDDLISYFNPSTKWTLLNPARLDRLEARLRQIYDQGGQAWLETTAIDEITLRPGGAAWLGAHTKSLSLYKLTDHGYDINLVQVFPNLSGN
jgi:hypothetical protein